MNKVIILCLAVSFAAAQLAAADFTNYKGLTDDEVLINPTGKREMRMDEEAVQEAKQWDFVTNGKPDPAKQQELYGFIEEHRRSTYQTMVNPLFAADLVAKDKMVTRSYSGRINGLRFGPDKSDEDLQTFLDDAGLQQGASDTEFKKGSDKYQFKNVVVNYYFQNKPTTKSANRRAEWGSTAFAEKYTKVTRTVGEFSLKSDVGNPPFSPPGDVAFDAGVNDDATEQPLEASQAADTDVGELDYTMEVFVEMTGEVHKNGALLQKFEEMAEAPVARTTLYVEDYVPPLPEELGSLEVQSNSQALAPKGDSNGNAFIPGMARFYDNDGSGMNTSGINPEERPTELYWWPNADNVDRDGDGVKDFTWENIAMKNNNEADLAVNNTFNYEVGMSLYQRIKYKDDPNAYDQPDGWKYMYYLPYRPVNNELWGPYAGRVHSGAVNMDGWDKYDVDGEGGQYFADLYKPIVFPDTMNYGGRTYKPKGLIDAIHDMGDAGVEVQQKMSQLQSAYGFDHIAGISVKWNRECVQGITVGTTADPDLKIPEGTMLLPTGFSGAKLAKSSGAFQTNTDRLGSFEAEYDNVDNANAPQSLMGTLAEGTHARDSFFKINAADCCNNDVVIASGTYGSEDNLKPIPKLVIEEMDSHNSGKVYLDVATVPNDMPGAGSPMGAYNPDRVYTKLHDAALPLYGSGVQGDSVRGYGNYSNNACTWNGLCQAQTLQNPVDNQKYAYLAMRYFDNEPPFEEDRRYNVTITADDNVGPAIDPDNGSVFYPIRHLSYVFYYHPTAQSIDSLPAQCKQAHTGDPDTVRQNVTNAMEAAGFRQVDRGAVVDLDINAADTEWTREPSTSFEYKFKSPGIWVVRVDAIDRSSNGRTMLVPVLVGDVALKTRSIDMDSRKID